MAHEDIPDQDPKASELPDEQQQAEAANDAILRNLASLMGQEETAKEAFRSNAKTLDNSDTTTDKDQSSDVQNARVGHQPAHVQDQENDASTAAELRRSQRLQKSSSITPESSSDQEIEVVFDEDCNPAEKSTEPGAHDTAGAKLVEHDTQQSAKDDSNTGWKFFLPALSGLELTSVAVLLVTLLCAALMFASSINEAITSFRKAAPLEHTTPPHSISGQLLKLTGIRCHWRDRDEHDRVQEGSRILPVIQIESGKGTGTLQIIFQDEIGRVRGDTHIFRLSSGTLPHSTDGTLINALGTSGMTNEIQFTDHRLAVGAENNEYWTVSFKESADEQNWKLIGKYRLPKDRL